MQKKTGKKKKTQGTAQSLRKPPLASGVGAGS